MRKTLLNAAIDVIAVLAGLNNGAFAIYDAASLHQLVRKKHRKQWIQAVKFSPNGHYVAVGSHDNYIDVYNVNKDTGGIQRRVGVCKGHSSYITHMDWSADSTYLRTNSGTFELSTWDATDGEPVAAELVKSSAWSSESCTLAWSVAGVWPKCTDGTDITSVDVSHSKETLLSTDDFGGVNLHCYPCTTAEQQDTGRFRGHSAHVTHAFFTSGDQYVVSSGGSDRCLFLWRHGDEEGLEEDSDPEDHYDSEVGEDADEYGTKLKIQASQGAYGVEMDGIDDMQGLVPCDGNAAWSKPWLTAIAAPEGVAASDGALPPSHLELDWVHGYRACDTRSTAAYTSTGSICYITASLGVVYDAAQHTQKHFRVHQNDVVAFCMSADGKLAATGEMGHIPLVCIWDTNTLEVKAKLRGFHRNAVRSLCFSPDGKYLASIGQDMHHSYVLYEVETGAVLASAKTNQTAVYSVAIDENKNVVVMGKRYAGFSQYMESGTQSFKKAMGMGCSRMTFLCVAFVADKAISGTSAGNIVQFHEGQAVNVAEGHDGPVQTICQSGDGFVTGGKDGSVIVWGGDLTKTQVYDMNTVLPECWEPRRIRSVCQGPEGKLLLGSYQGELIELENGEGKFVVQNHSRGELWGLAMHPTQQVGVTASDDKTVRLWDLKEHKMLKLTAISAEGRSVSFTPDGSQIVVGCSTGMLLLLDANDLTEQKSTKLKGDEWISDLKYSPDGTKLAVGCHDDYIHLLDAASFEVLGKCKGHSSYITHLDWSKDSAHLRSNSASCELLFWDSATGAVVQAETMRNTEWHTCTCTLAWEVQGIWPMFADGVNVNSVEKSHDGSLLVSADDKGRVKLFKSPAASRNVQVSSQAVHSSHVTVARFSPNDEFVMSAGGNDMCIMQWKMTANA